MLWPVVGLGVVGFYAAIVALLFLFQTRLVYFPTRRIEKTPHDLGLAYEEVRFETADAVEVSGWFVPVEPARAVLLFFHGNAGNISHRLESLALFHSLGLSTMIIDYRGYGHSQGSPGEQGTYLDADAAWRYLVEQRQVPPAEIIVFGRSLGGAVAAWLAHKHSPCVLILESTFTSVPDVAAERFPFLPARFLARVHYDTLGRLPEIPCPILVVHSPDDEVIAYHHGQRLFSAAPEPKVFLEIQGDHNEGFLISANYRAGLEAFLARYGPERS